MALDERLKEYESKRDLKASPEPRGNGRKKKGEEPIFVIQKHDARNLHYDFRLEVDGVLASWAVPKGPSTDPGVKRLAIHVEDHPMDYAEFEGVIPEGMYGAGTVLVWDMGTYKNLMAEKKDPLTMRESIEKGHVEVWLEGKKLRGGFALVHMKDRGDNQWLLVKMKDKFADAKRDPLTDEPDSVLSQASLEEIRQSIEEGQSDSSGRS